MALQRPLPGQYNGPKEDPFSDSVFSAEYPTLYDYLTSTTWSDGSSRVTSTLLLFVENGVLKLCINDRDNNRSAFLTAPTVQSLLASLEEKLCGERLDWKIKQTYQRKESSPPW